MDDLKALTAVLSKPEPSAEAVARSRSRLQDRMRRPVRRPFRRLVPVLGLTTAATVAAVVVIGTGATTTAGQPSSAREILLVAAASAERAPQGSGTYWHVRRQWQNTDIPQMESWTSRDGRRWSKGEPGAPPGAVVPDPVPLMLKGAEVSFEDLERLPSDPEALKARLAEREGRDSNMSESEQRGEPTFPLLALISELPTPPEVRSAAFQALATMPGVERTGTAEDGQELLIPDPDGRREIKLVVDPETARVTRTNFLIGDDGSVGWTNGFISVTTSWTDHAPQ
ncbi:CU044_5270 family protein [Nonomuraea sp. SYSU D8015]|uniref:CU044_5270 family protein n=1 Tax=Nonomuraea sp. SYSU D8015 TaxID=2593644 RepID=UPI00166045A1|nr:CU044_5270 family protein [Nonomuraea sp. SYSU D8015]